jgi:hypothetical protein
LRFLAFICYKQSTESRSVAEPDFVATLVRARHLSFKRAS